MRADTALFAASNVATVKRPRYVVELSFDEDNTILAYFTSHDDAALPGGGTVVPGVLEQLSGTSQTLNPDRANSTIGSISFGLVDKARIITDTLGSQLILGRSTRRQRARVYVGFEGLAWADYTLVQTQLVSEITYAEGAYAIKCTDVQREMRKDIFVLAKTTLALPLNATATTVDVFDTSKFFTLAHGTSYSDAPSATVGYIKIQDEVIRYTGKTPTSFTDCTRGALNTRAVEHPVDVQLTPDRRTPVDEYVYLEMPAVKLMYALLTGVLNGQGGATLPAEWHLGIPASYVRLSDFTSIGADLWDTSDDEQGFVVRLEDLDKTDGKRFIEAELALLAGVFMPVYSDGALGLRRMANVLAGAAYSAQLDASNLTDVGELVHDFGAMHNVIQIDWNWEPLKRSFTRTNLLIDQVSVTTHKRSDPLKLAFRGLHGSRHSQAILSQRFDSLRDRYTGPPLRIDVGALPSMNAIEVGDIVRVRPGAGVRDFVANGDLDRSFEVQNVTVDWVTGALGLRLFGSSQQPGASPPSADVTVLTSAWYVGEGTELSTVLTISGSGPAHVTAGGTLTGTADMNSPASIYYFDGDLQIDTGVTIAITGNVQLRVKGFLQNNGKIDGKGAGLPGAAAIVGTPASLSDFNPGTPGFIGVTEAGGALKGFNTNKRSGGGLFSHGFRTSTLRLTSLRAPALGGANATMPSLNLAWNGTVLSGIPNDQRGTSGSSGLPAVGQNMVSEGDSSGQLSLGLPVPGGAGGAGGAGMAIVCRGFAQGVVGVIDLSGGDGATGASFGGQEAIFRFIFKAGSGAGGAPGGLSVILDGSTTIATGLTEAGFVALNGKSPIRPVRATAAEEEMPSVFDLQFSSFFVGGGDGSAFPLPSLSGGRGGARVQFVPGAEALVEDPSAATLLAPTNLGLASGTAELLIQLDGTVVPRIKVTWTPSVDNRTLGYDLQFKESADSDWLSAPQIIGQTVAVAWVVDVTDGVNHDVRLRAAGAARQVSEWVTITGFNVAGKSLPPSNVGGLSFTDPFLSWPVVLDADLAGYIVRFNPGADSAWETATPAHEAGFITENEFDTGDIVGGSTTLLVKAVDTSGNESSAVSSLLVDLRPAQPTLFQVSRQPDGTREFSWANTAPPSDLDGVALRFFLGTTSDWDAMTPLHTGVLKASPFETNQLAAGTYTFAAKNVDRSGNASAVAVFITAVTIADPRIAGAVEDHREEPGWTETKASCHVDATTGWLVADGTATWTTLPATWAGWLEWNFTPVSPITYTRQIDIGVKVKFVPLVTVLADGAQVIEEQHSDDDISYTAFAAIGPVVDARYVRIRVTVTGTYPKIKTERIILSASPIEEIIEDQNSASLTGAYRIGVGDVRVPITKLYKVIKSVQVTLQSVGPGWSTELIDKDTVTGPRIKIYNASDALADAVFDAFVSGV